MYITIKVKSRKHLLLAMGILNHERPTLPKDQNQRRNLKRVDIKK